MKGFFDKELIQHIPYKSEKGMLSCASCGLYKSAQTPKMQPHGNFKKEIMIIGESPAKEDDEKGAPWQGKAGRIMERKYKQLGVNLHEDCVSINAVACRAVDKQGNSRAPTEQEIACCRQKVLLAIKKYTPKVIILQGGSAISSLITGYKWRGSPTGVTAWRGWTIPDRETGAWLCPTFHPSFIENQEEKNEVEVLWTNDLRQAVSKIQTPFPFFLLEKEENCVEVCYDDEKILKSLSKQKKGVLAFDIETTGLKPYNKNDHKIISISFCNDLNKAYAIPFPTQKKSLKLLKYILENPNIGKLGANIKYEDNWLKILAGINICPWVFDTMQAAHILDNRPGITGLKFQGYVHFGLPNYDEEIKQYLKSPDANTPNKIEELAKDKEGFHKLLLYNGIDSLMTYRLAIKQMSEIERVR